MDNRQRADLNRSKTRNIAPSSSAEASLEKIDSTEVNPCPDGREGKSDKPDKPDKPRCTDDKEPSVENTKTYKRTRDAIYSRRKYVRKKIEFEVLDQECARLRAQNTALKAAQGQLKSLVERANEILLDEQLPEQVYQHDLVESDQKLLPIESHISPQHEMRSNANVLFQVPASGAQRHIAHAFQPDSFARGEMANLTQPGGLPSRQLESLLDTGRTLPTTSAAILPTTTQGLYSSSETMPGASWEHGDIGASARASLDETLSSENARVRTNPGLENWGFQHLLGPTLPNQTPYQFPYQATHQPQAPYNPSYHPLYQAPYQALPQQALPMDPRALQLHNEEAKMPALHPTLSQVPYQQTQSQAQPADDDASASDLLLALALQSSRGGPPSQVGSVYRGDPPNQGDT